jgi:hypothetical protein
MQLEMMFPLFNKREKFLRLIRREGMGLEVLTVTFWLIMP